jgi:hypothetical protein
MYIITVNIFPQRTMRAVEMLFEHVEQVADDGTSLVEQFHALRDFQVATNCRILTKHGLECKERNAL